MDWTLTRYPERIVSSVANGAAPGSSRGSAKRVMAREMPGGPPHPQPRPLECTVPVTEREFLTARSMPSESFQLHCLHLAVTLRPVGVGSGAVSGTGCTGALRPCCASDGPGNLDG